MEKEFVPYELAVKLKELGFDEPCLAGFRKYGYNMVLMSKIKDNTYPRIETVGFGKYCHQNKHIVKAPLWQQAFDWFIYNYGFIPIIKTKGYSYQYDIQVITQDFISPKNSFTNYQEARQACLEKLITLI